MLKLLCGYCRVANFTLSLSRQLHGRPAASLHVVLLLISKPHRPAFRYSPGVVLTTGVFRKVGLRAGEEEISCHDAHEDEGEVRALCSGAAHDVT